MDRAVVDPYRAAAAAPAFEPGGGVLHPVRVVALGEILVGVRATAFLQKFSMRSALVSLAPLLGKPTMGLTALAVGIASLVARLRGDRDLSRALRKTAGKHTMLLGAQIIPGLGNIASAYSAAIDRRDLKALTTVRQMNQLQRAVPPPLPPR